MSLKLDSLIANWIENDPVRQHSNLQTEEELDNFVRTQLEEESVMFAKAISVLGGNAETLRELGFNLTEGSRPLEEVNLHFPSPVAGGPGVVGKRIIYQSSNRSNLLLDLTYFNQDVHTVYGLTHPTYNTDPTIFNKASIIMLSSASLEEYQNTLQE